IVMNKIAVLTGASYGLGETISKKLLTLGYKVYGVSRSRPNITSDKFVWIKANLLNDSELAAIFGKVPEQKINLLVNNVGTAFLKKTLEYTDDDFDRMFNLNFKIHAKITKLFFSRL